MILQGCFIGAVVLLATLISPQVSLTGISAVMAAYVFARLIGIESDFLSSGFFTYNTLLVGLSLGNLFALSALSLLLAAAAGIITLMLSMMLNNLFSEYLLKQHLNIALITTSACVVAFHLQRAG